MIDILSLPRRNKVSGNPALLKMISYKTGLPINSLPGWELIPLNCKLPMLKCPGNQVIFSKNKIGQDFKSGKQEFECSVTEHIPEYNPLHDSNLKTFYSNERNLKRLRENGEITQDNDVICNLKDFNQHRQELHKSQLYYILQAYKRRESEQYDRMLIANAESITKKDHQNLAARHQCTEEFKRLENLATMQNMLLEHRKMLTNMRVAAHISMCQDLMRKLLIKQKKLFQFKKDRFNKNMRILRKQRLVKNTEHQIQSWRKRLDERIANQRRIEYLLQEVEKEREAFIDRHKAHYREKWQRIQDEIKERAQKAITARQPKRKRRKKKKSTLQERKPSFCDEYQATFEGLLDSDLCYALNAAIAMEGQTALSFAPDDPIYKAAQYILDYIISGLNDDLSEDECALQVLISRIKDFVCDAKKYVHYKAYQIIGFARDHKAMEVPPSMAKQPKNHSRASHVSFSGVASTIGVGSYEIHPFVDVRPCSERRATPAGSLASLVVSQIGEQVIQDKVRLPHLNRNQIVFIEHYLVKFKRDLLVGLDKLVFAAIQCHFENRMMEVREELLLLDRNYLFEQIARGILSYAVNPLNYQSVLKLAVSVQSCEIIWELQQTMLKPGIDPRGQNHPVSCGTEQERETLALCIP
ncbi:GM16727 [Drosophila sechellia]|uniref:GM16727 n=1 Tax=Drosophila sechellia TaxID=7238 RepID=B4ICU2_DROSE|nr:GM16727 [Drosophila sechellia]